MIYRPASTLLFFLAIAFVVSSLSSTTLQAELVFLGYSHANNDNPQQNQDESIVDVINAYLHNQGITIAYDELNLIDKDEEDNEMDNDFVITDIDGNQGTYSYTGPGFADILTLKSGNQRVEVWAIPFDMQSGDWENQYKYGLSHASVWDIDNSAFANIPEPTSFAMFGLAMFGMSRRRRQR